MIPEWLDPTLVREDPLTVAALIAVGALIGTVGGLFGVSGCFLLTPLLGELVGIPYRYAVGSASCHAIGIAATALRRHLRIGKADVALGFIIAVGAALGSFCGSQILSALSCLLSVQTVDTTIRIVLTVVLLLVAFMIARPVKADGARPLLQRIAVGPRRALPGQPDITFSLSGTLAAAMFCGLVAGFLGLGGGVLYLPMLILAVGIEPIHAVRVSLIVVLCSAVGATIGHAWAGRASLTIAMLMMLGSSIGVQIGAHVCQKVHGSSVRRYFALVVLGTCAMVAWKLAKQLLGWDG